MTLLLDLTIRSSVLVLVGLSAAAALHRQSAALRHAVLTMAIVAAAAIVPLTVVVPAWRVSLPASVASSVSRSPARLPAPPVSNASPIVAPRASVPPRTLLGTAAVPRPTPRVTEVARVVWLGGVVAYVTVLLTGFVRLVRIARRAQRVVGGEWARTASQLHAAYGLRRPVMLLRTDAPNLLATFGLRRHRVLVPVHSSAWSHDRIEAVLSHEFAHVRRHDWLVQMCAESVRCVYWFNPVMWIACARLRRESEYACDDAVLGRGMAPGDYAVHLLELARACRRPRRPAALPALPMARASRLERRIAIMLNPAVNRTSASRPILVAAAVVLACLSLSVAAVRAGQGAQNPPPVPLAHSVQAVSPGVNLGGRNAPQDAPPPTSVAGSGDASPAVTPRTGVPAATLATVPALSRASAVPAAQIQQSGPAPLVGSIYDASGGVMPGVELTLRDAQQAARTTTTDAAGRFQFPAVAPGTYTLEAALPGFRTLRQNIELSTPADWDRVITLQLGQVSEKIVVTALRVEPTGVLQAQPTRLKVGGNVRAPRKLVDVRPVYPDSMREAGREAVVSLDAVIGIDGSVTSVRVISADIHPDFAIAAADAVRQWTFDPTRLNGAAVEVQMTVSVEFKLSK